MLKIYNELTIEETGTGRFDDGEIDNNINDTEEEEEDTEE